MSGAGKKGRTSVLAYGFRPFFMSAGIYAVISMLVWILSFPGNSLSIAGQPAQYWHGHEMIFGFIAAAIAGFMLTAVPSWTGQRGFAGRPLMLLFAVWLAGRIAMFLGEALPMPLLVAADLAFFPALIVLVAPSLFRTANRNRVLILVLALFWLADAAFWYGLATRQPVYSQTALRAALDLVLLLITIIGGRIVPAFTANALRAEGKPFAMRSHTIVERAVIVSMALYLVADSIGPLHSATAYIALLAACLHAVRLGGWCGWKSRSQAIVWILHAAYLWLPIGLALKGIYGLAGPTWAIHSLHALGAGAAGTMIMAVMTRASLGHTGRPLTVTKPIVAAYCLLLLAVCIRVFGQSVFPGAYLSVVTTAGALWVTSFSLFLWVYGPILISPRVDGKPG